MTGGVAVGAIIVLVARAVVPVGGTGEAAGWVVLQPAAKIKKKIITTRIELFFIFVSFDVRAAVLSQIYMGLAGSFHNPFKGIAHLRTYPS